MGLISIHSTPIQYKLQIEPARLEMQKQGATQGQTQQADAQLELHATRIQVRLDTTEMRHSMNLRSVPTMIKDEAQKGYQASLDAIAELSSFGTQVGQIQNGVSIVQVLAQRIQQQPDVITAFIPNVGPSISWDPGQLTVDYHPGELQTEWELSKNVLSYIPGGYEMIIEQYPKVQVEYLGQPNYFPASAAPSAGVN